jgi:hypothetical protein
VLQLHGHFNGAYASVPAGHVTPTGNTLTIVVDAATGEVTDAGLTDTKHQHLDESQGARHRTGP